MEPIQGSTSGHMQLDYMKAHLQQAVAHALHGGGASPPDFVGSDYYCEAALDHPPWERPVLYSNDTLWDGQDCRGLEHTCCDPPSLPWFCKELPQSTTDNLVFRICGDQSLADEDTPTDLVQLYIQ